MKSEKGKNLPEKKFRAGAITVTVWRNETEKGSYSSVQLERSYKDKDNNWKKTNSMRLNDLPRASLLLNKAYEHLVMKMQESEQQVAVESVM